MAQTADAKKESRYRGSLIGHVMAGCTKQKGSVVQCIFSGCLLNIGQQKPAYLKLHFFLQLIPNTELSDAIWFKRAVGKNNLGNILTEARKQFGLAGRKVSNHSVRKTGIMRLTDGNVLET